MSRTADRLYAMGFRLVDDGKGGFAKAELGNDVCLFIEQMKKGLWRCRAAMPMTGRRAVASFATFSAERPDEAADGCLLAAMAKLGRRKTSLEDEARRLGNALEAVEVARTKNHKKEN